MKNIIPKENTSKILSNSESILQLRFEVFIVPKVNKKENQLVLK
jgi:hypothetical protein